MNRKKFYFYQICKSFMPIYPLYALLFASKGLTIAQISLLFTIWTIPCIILELPSGILADRWSRKQLLVLSGLFHTIAFACWLFADGFLLYAIGFIFWGTSSACNSGTKEALLYDSLKAEKREASFGMVYGKGTALSRISEVIACILGGFLASQVGMVWPLIISILFSIFMTLIALSMKEVNYYKESHNEDNVTMRQFLSEGIKFFTKKRSVLLVLLLAIIIISTAEVLDEYDQLIITDLGFTLTAVGIWTAFRKLLESIGSLIAPYLKCWFQKYLHINHMLHCISFLGITSSIFLGLTAFIANLWAIPFYAMYYWCMAVGSVLMEEYLQQKVEEEGRSTIHSIMSLMMNLFGALSFQIFGMLFSWQGLFPGLIIISILLLAFIPIICVCYHKKAHLVTKPTQS